MKAITEKFEMGWVKGLGYDFRRDILSLEWNIPNFIILNLYLTISLLFVLFLGNLLVVVLN